MKPSVNLDKWWDGNVSTRMREVLELVLEAIGEDYSSLEMILESINEWDPNHGPEGWPALRAIPVNRREVVHALDELTREGYVQAYWLQAGEAQTAEFKAEAIRDLWFCATPRGSRAIDHILEQVSGPGSTD